jgi:16S rRNA (uracil1498-N3)-methyltransferase
VRNCRNRENSSHGNYVKEGSHIKARDEKARGEKSSHQKEVAGCSTKKATGRGCSPSIPFLFAKHTTARRSIERKPAKMDCMARRRWIADTWDDTSAVLVGAQAQHLARVLRAAPGMRCDVVAGTRVWAAAITDVQSSDQDARVMFALEQELAANAALPLTLLLAVFKFDRLEWAIEKATELGVQRIVPVVTRRTEKHLAHAAVARVERWRRLVHEAAKQSRRADVPVVADAIPLKQALQEQWPGAKLLLAENEKIVLLGDALASVAESEQISLAIGPEGGWAPDEEQVFSAGGWRPVSLGPRILRAETAAIAATSIVASALLRLGTS